MFFCPAQSEHERHPGNMSEERRSSAHSRTQRRGKSNHFIFLNLSFPLFPFGWNDLLEKKNWRGKNFWQTFFNHELAELNNWDSFKSMSKNKLEFSNMKKNIWATVESHLCVCVCLCVLRCGLWQLQQPARTLVQTLTRTQRPLGPDTRLGAAYWRLCEFVCFNQSWGFMSQPVNSWKLLCGPAIIFTIKWNWVLVHPLRFPFVDPKKKQTAVKVFGWRKEDTG